MRDTHETIEYIYEKLGSQEIMQMFTSGNVILDFIPMNILFKFFSTCVLNLASSEAKFFEGKKIVDNFRIHNSFFKKKTRK